MLLLCSRLFFFSSCYWGKSLANLLHFLVDGTGKHINVFQDPVSGSQCFYHIISLIQSFLINFFFLLSLQRVFSYGFSELLLADLQMAKAVLFLRKLFIYDAARLTKV